jgi:glycosyltransferase involved in cell wall biosynthesis
MRICIIGPFSGYSDEGFKNIAKNLAKNLSFHHTVLILDSTNVFTLQFWISLKRSSPEVIHYISAPTLSSIFILKIGRYICGANTKTVVSSLYSHGYKLIKNPVKRFLVQTWKPTIILTQSSSLDREFSSLGIKTKYLPNGVDIDRFAPLPDVKMRKQLREKYALNPDTFIILHVGHITPKRGLAICSLVQKQFRSSQVLIIGSTHFKTDQKLYANLENDGCIIWNRYFDHIEELYQLSDCYIFPPSDTIFLPLSILEAMACNLPVITVKFEGLETFFSEGDGLFFADTIDDFFHCIDQVANKNSSFRTREKIRNFSWNSLITDLTDIYRQLIEKDSP